MPSLLKSVQVSHQEDWLSIYTNYQTWLQKDVRSVHTEKTQTWKRHRFHADSVNFRQTEILMLSLWPGERNWKRSQQNPWIRIGKGLWCAHTTLHLDRHRDLERHMQWWIQVPPPAQNFLNFMQLQLASPPTGNPESTPDMLNYFGTQ